jgi:hypothetical protein
MRHRRIKVRGVRTDELDTEQYGLVLWLQAKRALRERREQEAKARARATKQERQRG